MLFAEVTKIMFQHVTVNQVSKEMVTIVEDLFRLQSLQPQLQIHAMLKEFVVEVLLVLIDMAGPNVNAEVKLSITDHHVVTEN